MTQPLPPRIVFDDGFLMPGTSWDQFVNLIAAGARISPRLARKHLALAEKEGWIERVPSSDGSVAIRLTIPEHARPKEGAR
jgi:hypothetical protein